MRTGIQEELELYMSKSVAQASNREIYEALLLFVQKLAAGKERAAGKKKLYYISAEFLIGKLLSNNMINLGIYDEVKEMLFQNGKDICQIEEVEPEPSLGNGGLGRLAACFLDSIATLGLPGDGIGLNYHLGLFKQEFKDHLQKELPNPWIEKQSWLTKTDVVYPVSFRGLKVNARMYDIAVTGYHDQTNKLHLFDIDSVDEGIVEDGIHFDKEDIAKNLTLFLYPDDSDEKGRLLRIYQQYFMVSSAAQMILDECVQKGSTLYDLPDYAVIQINDTHPTMVIPELIRLLVERGLDIDEAIDVVSRTCAYTNHTILVEALEKWPIGYLKKVVPQLVPIIEILDDKVRRRFSDESTAIIDRNDTVHMAHIDIHYGFSVNGVAALHTDILKQSELNHFYKIYPDKFNNKTNGITFRRWLLHCNPRLTALLDETIKDEYKEDASKLVKLLEYKDDETVLKRLLEIKKENKKDLAAYLKETQAIEIDADTIFDIQVKRLHEYKRQQLNVLNIIAEYQMLKANPNMEFQPRTYIFASKAAPGYFMAKKIIELIDALSKVVNNDPDIKGRIKVVFMEDYNVSLAEMLMPAADISEQISLAGTEASGTGNMKLMLNGAITLGTLDGANVEIHDAVGDDNIFIFGLKTPEVMELQKKGYNPMEYMYNNETLKSAVEFIQAGVNGKSFGEISSSLMNVDQYMALADFADYQKAQKLSAQAYQDKERFAKMSLMNISGAGIFSADRSIMDYANNIWHTQPVKFKEETPKTSKKSAPMTKEEKKPAKKSTAKKAEKKVEPKKEVKKETPKKAEPKKSAKKTTKKSK